MSVFVRDGFIDRYSGAHLLFPGTIRLVSRLLPSEFPFHSKWKMSETHMIYWELSPTIDHVVPVDYVEHNNRWLRDRYIRRWHRVAVATTMQQAPRACRELEPGYTNQKARRGGAVSRHCLSSVRPNAGHPLMFETRTDTTAINAFFPPLPPSSYKCGSPAPVRLHQERFSAPVQT